MTTYHYINIFIIMFTEPVWSPYWNHGWPVKSKDMPASLQLHTLIVYTWIEFSDFLHVFSWGPPNWLRNDHIIIQVLLYKGGRWI